MLPTKFRFIWPSGFRREDFLEIDQSETRIDVAAIFVNQSELNEQSLQRTFQGCFRSNFNSFGKAVAEERSFQKSTNQKQELPVAPMFVNGSKLNEQNLQRTSIHASYQVSVHLAKGFQRRRFLRNQKQELPVAAMFVNGSGQNEQYIQKTFHRCFLPSFG